MCVAVPMMLTIASGVLSAGTAMAQVIQGNAVAEQTAQAANKAASLDYSIMAQRQQQIGEQAAQDAFERQRQGLRERGKLMVAMGESGVLGASPLRELENSIFQSDYDKSIIESNRDNAISQTELQKKAIYAEASSRINQARSMSTNPFLAMLKIGMAGGSGALSGYTMGKTLFPVG